MCESVNVSLWNAAEAQLQEHLCTTRLHAYAVCSTVTLLVARACTVMEQQLGDDRDLLKLTSNAVCMQSHGISQGTHAMLTRSRRSTPPRSVS